MCIYKVILKEMNDIVHQQYLNRRYFLFFFVVVVVVVLRVVFNLLCMSRYSAS